MLKLYMTPEKGDAEMKAPKIALFLTFLLLALTITNAGAAGLRCGVRLITVGDLKSRVLAECGQPDQIDVWEEERLYGFDHHPSYYGIYDNYEHRIPQYKYERPYRIRKLVIVEEWTYNHGPGRFMDHLRLENGIVRRITSGTYGY